MILFISGCGSGVGKTYINIKLNQDLMKRGFNICSLKPIETGVEEIPQDAMLHLQNQSTRLGLSDICFYTFPLPSAPFVADRDNIIDISFIIKRIKDLEKSHDIVLVEGAGGLFVPIKRDYFFIDLIKELDSTCLLVCDDKLGCINQLLVHREALQNRGIRHFSIINLLYNDDFYKVSYPYLRELERNFIFQEQRDELLDSISLLKY